MAGNVLIKPAHRRRLAMWMTQGVLLLQFSLLLTLAVTPTWHPPRVRLFELLWAAMHRPTFYPMVALLIGGPALTVLAWRVRGRHRALLILGWATCIALCIIFFEQRLILMLDVLRWQMLR